MEKEWRLRSELRGGELWNYQEGGKHAVSGTLLVCTSLSSRFQLLLCVKRGSHEMLGAKVHYIKCIKYECKNKCKIYTHSYTCVYIFKCTDV